jgi:hypothetical protein
MSFDYLNTSSNYSNQYSRDEIVKNEKMKSKNHRDSQSAISNSVKKKKKSNDSEDSLNKKNLLGKKTFRKDNMRSKVINHFFKFLIDYLNDKVKKIYSYQKVIFEKINYGERKKVNIDSIKLIMNKTISEICEFDISSKSQLFNKKNNLESLKLISEDLKEGFINMKILKFYEEYYLCDKNLKNEFEINLNCKNFKYLLEEYNDNYYERKLYEETGKNLITQFINQKSKKKNKKNNIEINNKNISVKENHISEKFDYINSSMNDSENKLKEFDLKLSFHDDYSNIECDTNSSPHSKEGKLIFDIDSNNFDYQFFI